MLGQIKATMNKKVSKLAVNNTSAANSPASPNTPKKNRKKRNKSGTKRVEKGKEPSSEKPLEGGGGKKEVNKKKIKEESEKSSSNTEDDGASSRKNKKKSMMKWIGGNMDKVVNFFDKDKHPPGQVVDNKPDPKYCAQKIAQSERPDLFEGIKATEMLEEEFQLLDEHLLRQGELRIDSSFTLGKVVDMDSKLKVGSGDEMEVMLLWSYGRFGAVYMVSKETDSEQERRGMPRCFALKTARRMYASSRINHEIRVLQSIYSNNRKLGNPTHITPIFFHGQTGGTPYFMMPMLDCSLERVRQEIGYKLPWSDAFYIGQEALTGIKECHSHSIIHRDIKPTNLLLGIQNNKIWWLCDFGDASRIGSKQYLSSPDSLTLPFLSREAHVAIGQLIPSNIRMDIESWFYMLLDLFVGLPWKMYTEESDTLSAKHQFWSSIDSFFGRNDEKTPDQLTYLAKIVSGNLDGNTYSKLSAVLKDGFHKSLGESSWKPSWITKRKPRQIIPNQKAGRKETGNKSKKSKNKGKKKFF